jgi:hypothetical protein
MFFQLVTEVRLAHCPVQRLDVVGSCCSHGKFPCSLADYHNPAGISSRP